MREKESEREDQQRLELDSNEPFQRREWRVQRIGWTLWGLIVLAGLAGVLGPGPLSRTSVASSDGRLSITYDRFVHYHHAVELRLFIRPSPRDEEVRVELSQMLLDRLEISRIEPEPQRRKLTANGAEYAFVADPEADLLQITFHVENDAMGRGAGSIRLVDDEPLQVKQFVFP